jgi:hypothetical protein
MKKRIVFYFLFIYISLSGFSQEMRFGIVVDPVISWMKPDVNDVSSKGSVMGFNIGLVADRFFARNYAFTTGISIHHSGGSLFYEPATILHLNRGSVDLLPKTKVDFKLQYLDIPLGIKLFTNKIGYNTFYGQLGLNAMINIKATGSATSGGVANDNIGKEIGFFDFSYHIGAGVERNLGGNTRIVVGLMFMNGFTDITSRAADKVILNNIIIRLGVMF